MVNLATFVSRDEKRNRPLIGMLPTLSGKSTAGNGSGSQEISNLPHTFPTIVSTDTQNDLVETVDDQGQES